MSVTFCENFVFLIDFIKKVCYNFINRSYLILTDSGGIQEEAPSLGKPVLVLRDTTERPEGIEAGTLKLVGTDEEIIYNETIKLLNDIEEYNKMSKATNPYGDGTASIQIVDAIINKYSKELTETFLNGMGDEKEKVQDVTFWESLKGFFALSPEVSKICLMQFFTWIGTMCMMINFTQYAIHTVYGVPDLSSASEAVRDGFSQAVLAGTNFSSISFAIFNLVCFLVAIPIGVLSAKYGNKKVHIISMVSMIFAYLGMAFFKNPVAVTLMMGLAGIGWASICALPFAMLSQYIKPGTEGSVMGIFNIFIAGPQVFVCTLVSWIINQCKFNVPDGINFHWEYTFIIGAFCLIVASIIASKVKEKSVG